MTRILCLWLPNWAIQRAIRIRPELKGRPVALVVSCPRGGEVAACCRSAVEQGVRPGMPVVEAQSLVRELAIAAYDAAAERRALVKCAEACERFSPRVAIEEETEPESLLLDISNLEHLWGTETRLVETVRKFFTRRSYEVQIGIAETVGAAWAAAHFASERAGSSSSPPQARNLQNDKSKSQTAEAANGNSHFSIFDFPTQSLRIPEDIALTLRDLGLETVGQLMTLPRDGLATRFGEELLRRLDQLTGAGRAVLEPRRAPAAFEVGLALEEPTGDRHLLMHVLQQLVDRLAQQLAARDQGTVLLMCSLRCVDGSLVRLRVGLLQPSACAQQLLELIELHLESLTLKSEVDRIDLQVAVAGRLGERQGELFTDRWTADPHQLAVLVNRLSSRLGYDRVLQAQLRASAVPERTVSFVPMAQYSERKLRTTTMCKLKDAQRQGSSQNDLPPPPRPVLLYPTPQAMKVVCIAPDGPPQAVWLGKRRDSIVSCVGPERIESLWWRGPTVRRDYYRIATESGHHLWMFRRLNDRQWFVHGVFA